MIINSSVEETGPGLYSSVQASAMWRLSVIHCIILACNTPWSSFNLHPLPVNAAFEISGTCPKLKAGLFWVLKKTMGSKTTTLLLVLLVGVYMFARDWNHSWRFSEVLEKLGMIFFSSRRERDTHSKLSFKEEIREERALIEGNRPHSLTRCWIVLLPSKLNYKIHQLCALFYLASERSILAVINGP